MTQFAHPFAFVLFAVLPVLWWLWSRKGRRRVLRFPHLGAVGSAGGFTRLGAVAPGLRTIALGCLIVALARPQQADVATSLYAEGVAIQLVVDISGSMADTDMSSRDARATRLDVVKEVVRDFVAGAERLNLPGRRNDLIGLIAFALYPDSVCPLTLDHDTLLEILATLEPTRIRTESATAIGDALALATERVRNIERTGGAGEQYNITSRVVILLTDGEDNASQIDPLDAARLAAEFDIKVHTILAGTGERVGFVRRAVDDSVLRKIAELTGGEFFAASSPQALESIYEQIDALERTRIEERRFLDYEERSGPWLIAAFAAEALRLLLTSVWLRKIP